MKGLRPLSSENIYENTYYILIKVGERWKQEITIIHHSIIINIG